jgi:hypothetical protein
MQRVEPPGTIIGIIHSATMSSLLGGQSNTARDTGRVFVSFGLPPLSMRGAYSRRRTPGRRGATKSSIAASGVVAAPAGWVASINVLASSPDARLRCTGICHPA